MDFGIGLCIKKFYSLGTDFVNGVSLSSEFIGKRIFLYIEGILFHPPLVFDEIYWTSALLAVIMLSHVFNWVTIWYFIRLVCEELGWVNDYSCGWG